MVCRRLRRWSVKRERCWRRWSKLGEWLSAVEHYVVDAAGFDRQIIRRFRARRFFGAMTWCHDLGATLIAPIAHPRHTFRGDQPGDGDR
jgi:hypothetical protein